MFGWRPENGLKHLSDKPVGVKHRALDAIFAKKSCGWEPKVSLEEGMRRTIEWYVENRDVDAVRAQLGELLMAR